MKNKKRNAIAAIAKGLMTKFSVLETLVKDTQENFAYILKEEKLLKGEFSKLLEKQSRSLVNLEKVFKHPVMNISDEKILEIVKLARARRGEIEVKDMPGAAAAAKEVNTPIDVCDGQIKMLTMLSENVKTDFAYFNTLYQELTEKALKN